MELVIDLVLTNEAEQISQLLIEAWVLGDLVLPVYLCDVDEAITHISVAVIVTKDTRKQNNIR